MISISSHSFHVSNVVYCRITIIVKHVSNLIFYMICVISLHNNIIARVYCTIKTI
ncbi:hypothetical protein Hdeb2414_s0004g00137381 [Helianthus debilis subsp. tardiflorus]